MTQVPKTGGAWESKNIQPSDEAADYGVDEMDRIEQDKPTQSDCMSTVRTPRKTLRKGLTLRRSQPEGTNNGATSRAGATRTPCRRTSIARCCDG